MSRWFNNKKIATRIISGFLTIIAISCVIGIVGILNLNSVQDAYDLDYTNTAKAMEYLELISSKFQQIRVNTMAYGTIADTPELKQYYRERLTCTKASSTKTSRPTAMCWLDMTPPRYRQSWACSTTSTR